MQSLIAVLVVFASIAVPQSEAYGRGCFNEDYPAPVTAEDGSIITCPAVYYAEPVAVPVYPTPTPEWSRYHVR